MIDSKEPLSYNITIQCSLDGFCFVLHDREENKIIDIELYQTSETGEDTSIIEALDKAVFKKDLYGKRFHSARYIVNNRFHTLIPAELFDASQMESLLRFSHQLPQGYTFHHEDLPAINCVNVFALPQNQEQLIRERWNNVVITHQSSVFLHGILRENPMETQANAYVCVNSRDFDLAIIKEGRLLFCNNFKFNTKDDFLYFLMFTLEQQQVESQETPVYFTGLISGNSEIIKLCERYIKHIRFIRPDGSVEVDMAMSDIPFQYYYIPYKSLTCES